MSLRRFLSLALIVTLSGFLWADEPAPYELYVLGKQHEKKGNITQAYIFYSEAFAADPTNRKYRVKMESLRTRAALASNVVPPSPPKVASADDGDADESINEPPPTPKELTEARRPQPPLELNASQERKNLDLRGDSTSLWEQVAKAYGLDLVFDGDYQPQPTRRFQLDDADYRDAFYALMSATGTFIVPMSNRVFMVVQDTVQKRASVENNVSMELPIPEPVSLQDAQELARTVQQVMELQRFAVNASNRTIYFRDRISKAYPARELLYQLLYHRPQVQIDVEFVSVAKSDKFTFGIPLPTELSILSVGRIGLAGAAPDLSNLAGRLIFGGGQTVFGIGILATQLLAQRTQAESQTLLHAQVRAVDGQVANLHIGDKYPIQTSGFSFGAPAGSNLIGYTPSFNFEDLGLVLKITPKVHGNEEVTLDVDAEFKVLGTGSLNGIPVISNRKFVTQVRLRFNESAIVSGLLNTTDAKTITGIAGVMSIPFLGPALSNNTKENSENETFVTITPRLINEGPSAANTRAVFVGPDTRPRSPL